jgi:hypothetical protein
VKNLLGPDAGWSLAPVAEWLLGAFALPEGSA